MLKGTNTKHGIVREVLSRESLIVESFYRNGKLHGFSRQVDQDGYQVLNYKDGQLHGTCYYYDWYDTLEAVVEFENGEEVDSSEE